MTSKKKTRQNDLADRIRQQAIRHCIVYQDEEGCWYDRSPQLEGARQLTRDEVTAIGADRSIIVLRVNSH